MHKPVVAVMTIMKKILTWMIIMIMNTLPGSKGSMRIILKWVTTTSTIPITTITQRILINMVQISMEATAIQLLLYQFQWDLE